jgi:hypothetical protein
MVGTPLCQTFWSYDAVFEGTVVSIDAKAAEDTGPTYLRIPYRLVTFDVHRSWAFSRSTPFHRAST